MDNQGITPIGHRHSNKAYLDALTQALGSYTNLAVTGTTTLNAGLTGALRADAGVVSVDSDVTDIVTAATDSAAGKVELATDAEAVTGTDSGRATTPANITAKMAAPGAIGGTTPAAGAFTALSATGATTLDTALTGVLRADAGVVSVAMDKCWSVIPASKYTATPSDTDTLTMSDTTDLAVGTPIRYTIGGTAYYGQVVAETSNTSIDIVGASMGGDLTLLEVGDASRVVSVPMYVDGTYGDGADTDLLKNDMTTYLTWRMGKAYCVGFSAVQSGVDTGAEPKVQIRVNAAQAGTIDLQLGAADTWVHASAVGMDTSLYDINFNEALSVECTDAGGTGDAENLTVLATFVLV